MLWHRISLSGGLLQRLLSPLSVGEMSLLPVGPASTGSPATSRASARRANEVRLRLSGPTDRVRNARTLHALPQTARGFGQEYRARSLKIGQCVGVGACRT